MLKCAACNHVLVPDGGKTPPAWTYERCPECETMNKYRPTPDTPEGMTTEVILIRSDNGSEDRKVQFDAYAPRDEAKIQRDMSMFLGKKP